MAKKDKTPKQDEAPKKAKREVKVVKCPSAFPISTKPKKRPRGSESSSNHYENRKNKKDDNVLDLHQTAKEIRAYGAQAFLGKQKKDFQDETYYQLTGRHKKQTSVPLPLLRGLKKAAAKRERAAREEARKSGLVLPKAQQRQESKKSMTDAAFRKFGPAPNIGFMKSGVYKVSKDKTSGNGRRRR